jgi:hypothetical protein
MSKKPPIKSSSRKAKGRTLQKWVAEQISLLTELPHGKDMDIESRPMGQSGTDIRLSKEAKRLFSFSVECKWQETWAVPAWIEQAKANEQEGTDWLLVMKRSHKKPVIVMDAEAFFTIIANTKKWRNDDGR